MNIYRQQLTVKYCIIIWMSDVKMAGLVKREHREQLQLWRPLLYCNRPTLSSSWYFMILWTGLMSRSEICSLCPSCCFRSYKVEVRGYLY